MLETDAFYDSLFERVEEQPSNILASSPTSDDKLLERLANLLEGSVGSALAEKDWADAVSEGERRVEASIPPGYIDRDKLESELPERASGDYRIS